MSTLRIHDHAIFVSIFDKVVIKNFTIVRTNSDRSASHSLTAFRKIIFEPAHYIHIMDMLLYDMITAEIGRASCRERGEGDEGAGVVGDANMQSGERGAGHQQHCIAIQLESGQIWA